MTCKFLEVAEQWKYESNGPNSICDKQGCLDKSPAAFVGGSEMDVWAK
jgi:hypothetical protein